MSRGEGTPELKVQQIFTPGGFPAHTYIERAERGYESSLRDALSTPGHIISLAGPSKSGKTVLVERVVGVDNLIPVTGAGIERPEQLWDRILNWMDSPAEITSSTKQEGGGNLGGEVRGEVGAPGAKLQVTARASGQGSASTGTGQTFRRRGLQQVIDEIGNSDFVVLIDDFHYMGREAQEEVAKQLKDAARQGVSIITASVLHRSDDVVRALPELRGRVITVDLDYWDRPDLQKIAESGFSLLNVEVAPKVISSFVEESAGSPQLMQSICLYACYTVDVRQTMPLRRVLDEGTLDKRRAFERAVASADFRSMVDVLDSGPKTRGVERKIYTFKDGTSGDVYRCVLKAVAADPPTLSFPYADIVRRVEAVCASEQPVGSSLTGTCLHMSKLAQDNFPRERAIDWDEQKQVLDIPDPYLLFYCQCRNRSDQFRRNGFDHSPDVQSRCTS